MLILTRRVGETVMIGEDIAITVLRVKGNQVRLGVDAPKTVSVQREEIFQRMQTETTPDATAQVAAVEVEPAEVESVAKPERASNA